MLKKLETQTLMNFTADAPSHFILLVRSLTEADFNTLQDIWNLVKDKPIQRYDSNLSHPGFTETEPCLAIENLIKLSQLLFYFLMANAKLPLKSNSTSLFLTQASLWVPLTCVLKIQDGCCMSSILFHKTECGDRSGPLQSHYSLPSISPSPQSF